jgi:hypothetical protein
VGDLLLRLVELEEEALGELFVQHPVAVGEALDELLGQQHPAAVWEALQVLLFPRPAVQLDYLVSRGLVEGVVERSRY